MKKSELITIIKKIQNRYYLEEPSKVTYFRDKETGNVIFKLFFDSLYLPEQFRLNEPNVQNTFSTQNEVYEYEDDFKILELNQDEGYLKVLPDNQKFKIINSYSDVNKKEDSFEESLVHLASRRINEAFASNKGYILQESENTDEADNKDKKDPEDISSGDDVNKDAEKASKPEKKPVDFAVASITCAGLKSSKDLVEALPATLKGLQGNKPLKVIITSPKIGGGLYPFSGLSTIKVLDSVLKQQGIPGDLVYIGNSNNKKLASVIEASQIENVYRVTDTTEQAIKDQNLPGLLGNNSKDIDNPLVDSSTASEIEKIKGIINPRIETLKKNLKDGLPEPSFLQKISKKKFGKPDKWAKSVAWYEKAINDPKNIQARNANATLIDLFGEGEFKEVSQKAEARAKAFEDLNSEADNLTQMERIQIEVMKAGQQSIINAKGEILNRQAYDNGGGTVGGFTTTKSKLTGVASKAGEYKSKKEKPIKDSYGYNDCMTYITTEGEDWSPEFKQFMEYFSDEIDFSCTDGLIKPQEAKENPEDEETKDKSKENDAEKTDNQDQPKEAQDKETDANEESQDEEASDEAQDISTDDE